MLGAEPVLVVELELRHDLGRDEGVAQTLPNIFDGSGRGMNKIIRVETVVTEFVEDYLVGGEVGHLLRKLLLQAVDSHEQHGFAELILMHSVTLMTDRADGEHPVFVWHRTNERSPSGKDLFHSKPFARELAFGEFVAVGYDLVIAVIDVGSTKSDEDRICLCEREMQGSQRLQTTA